MLTITDCYIMSTRALNMTELMSRGSTNQYLPMCTLSLNLVVFNVEE